MKWFNKKWLTMMCSYVGIYLLFFTIGGYLYWGNLSVYVSSYFRNKLGPDPSIKTAWVISLIVIGMSTSSIAALYVANVIGQRCTVLLGCVLIDCGVLLGYFCVQRSVLLTNLALGLLHGFGIGLLFGMGLQNIVDFEPKNVGMVTGIIRTAVSCGAAILNQVIVYYVNPRNLTPDLYEDREKYFTQVEVLDKVPGTFLVIGVIYLCFHLIGVLLLRPQGGSGAQGRLSGECSKCGNGLRVDGGQDVERNELLASPSMITSSNKGQNKVRRETAMETSVVSVPAENLSPKQMLKCRSFYILCLAFYVCDYPTIVLTNYYKSFGQTLIADDQFFADLATAQLLVIMLTRPCWGALSDKCGVKATLVCLCFTGCIGSSFFFFTPMVNKWLYFVWTMVYTSCNSSLYIVFPLAVLKLYGKEHFSQNYGCVTFSSIFLNFMAPPIMSFLLHKYGWFYLFFSSACGYALGMVMCLLALSN